MPDVKGREQILRVHTRKIPLGANVNLERIAKGTPGLSGAELSNVVNEAALLAARRNKPVVDMNDLEDAKDKVMLGLERKSMVLTDEERKLTAYHESGHALVGLTVPGIDPIHKVTIVPRGRALGITFFLPEKDRRNVTKQWLLDQLDRLAAALLERETLDREEVDLVMAGKRLPPVAPASPPPAAPAPEGAARDKPAATRGPVLGSPPPEPAGA